jgi:multiple sugar transport system substrate-binding protein
MKEISRMSQHSIVRPSRRRLMQTGAAALALGAPAFVRKANAQSKFDWKRFAGQKIDVVLAKSPRADIYQRYEKEFTELTGIEVSSEQIPEQQQRQKVMIEFTSGSPSFDVVNLALHVQKRIAAKGKWMEDLRPYLADGAITSPDYDFADFGKAGLNYATQSDGRLDTIPIFVDYWMIYYNKELFAQNSNTRNRSMN